MANAPEELVFEPAVEAFNDYYGRVRGYVRQEMIRARLEPVIVTTDIERALDFGGGDARDSFWLATQQPIEVDYWDPNPREQQLAKERAQIEHPQGSVHLLPSNPLDDETPRYELVMMHGVLQYVRPEAAKVLMTRLTKVIMSGGMLSLATANLAGIRRDRRDATEGHSYINNLQLESHAYSADYLGRWLEELGFSVASIRGIRCMTDNDTRKISEVPEAELSAIVAQEAKWTAHGYSIDYGKMLHVLATKQ